MSYLLYWDPETGYDHGYSSYNYDKDNDTPLPLRYRIFLQLLAQELESRGIKTDTDESFQFNARTQRDLKEDDYNRLHEEADRIACEAEEIEAWNNRPYYTGL